MKNVLVLCTGNSCRSIMAEALINALGTGRLRAMSAGSHPSGQVHPESSATLIRHGIDPATPRSKSWLEMQHERFDLVITVCNQAAREVCPIFPGKVRKLHWDIPDPASAGGSQQQVEQAFDNTFRRLKNRIEKELL